MSNEEINPASCQTAVSRSVYLGRVVKVQKVFSFVKEERPFNSLYEAESWLREQGYVYGSLCVDAPIAVRKGEDFSHYDLPEKWKNFSDEDKANCDGVLVSRDFRNRPVTVFLFN
jgi:hypothetical protein